MYPPSSPQPLYLGTPPHRIDLSSTTADQGRCLKEQRPTCFARVRWRCWVVDQERKCFSDDYVV
jgi:hypothetical protein